MNKVLLFCLIFFSIALISSCSDSPTNSPAPTIITTTWKGGGGILTSITAKSEAIGSTGWLDLTQFSKIEISWQAEAKTFPPPNNEIFFSGLEGAYGQPKTQPFLLDTLSKPLNTYSVTLQTSQLIEKQHYYFILYVWSNNRLWDTTTHSTFTLSNLKILGYTE